MTDSYQDKQAYAAQVRAQMTAEQQQQQQFQQAAVQHQKDVSEIVTHGRNRFGREEFDAASDTVAEALGPEATAGLMGILRNHDDPAGIVYKLAETGDANLKRLRNMPAERARVEISRIESRLDPNGTSHTGDVPTWRSEGVVKGRLSDEAFRTPISDSVSDESWSKSFERYSRFGSNRRGR